MAYTAQRPHRLRFKAKSLPYAFLVSLLFPMAFVDPASAGQLGGLAGLVLFGALQKPFSGPCAPSGLGLGHGVAGRGSGWAHVCRVAAFVVGPHAAAVLVR